MMRSIFRRCLLVLALPALMAPGAAGAAERSEALVIPGLPEAQRAARLVVNQGVPGAAVAAGVVGAQRAGAVALARAGTTDLRRAGARASGWRFASRFRLASVSKLLSAVVVMRLVEQGRLSLGDTVAKWLPGLLPYGDRVTLEQLLAHRSGVFPFSSSPEFIQRLRSFPQSSLPPRELVGYAASEPLLFEPGSRYFYSNTDNVLAGLMAQAATGRSYARLLRRIVFDRVAGRMDSTFLARSSKLPRPFVHGYVIEGGKPEDVTRALNPATAWASGGIVSTPGDTATFMASLMRGDLIELASLRRMIRTAGPGNSDPTGPGTVPNRAGLGIFTYTLPCGKVYGHTGSFPGYRNFVAGRPGVPRGVLVTVNASEGYSKRADRAIVRLQRLAACEVLRPAARK